MHFTRDDWDEQFDHFPEVSRCEVCGKLLEDGEFVEHDFMLVCLDCHDEFVECHPRDSATT